jgi:hypothetical protein
MHIGHGASVLGISVILSVTSFSKAMWEAACDALLWICRDGDQQEVSAKLLLRGAGDRN